MSTALERALFAVPERRIAKRLGADGAHVFFNQLRDFQFIDRVNIDIHPRFNELVEPARDETAKRSVRKRSWVL